MQSIDFGLIFNIAWLVVSVLFGGLVTRLVIRTLEIQEREREGDFLALVYLRAAKEHIFVGEENGINATLDVGWSDKKDNIVNGLIQSAARSQKKYREKLYQTAMGMSKTTYRDYELYISSSEIGSLLTEMESCYFDIPSNTEN